MTYRVGPLKRAVKARLEGATLKALALVARARTATENFIFIFIIYLDLDYIMRKRCVVFVVKVLSHHNQYCCKTDTVRYNRVLRKIR